MTSGSSKLAMILNGADFKGVEVVLGGSGQFAGFDDKRKPLFFYHIHKTGGTTIARYLIDAIQSAQHMNRLEQKFIIGWEDTRDLQDSPSPIASQPYALVNSAFRFGHHRAYDQDFFLITVLREPTERVFSDYHYICWSNGVLPSDKALMDFATAPSNRNMACRHLSEKPSLDAPANDLRDDALVNLEAMDFLTITPKINEFLQDLWYYYGFDNLVANRANVTPKTERLDFDRFENDLREINRMDHDLYEYAKANQRTFSAAEPATLSQWTIARFGRTNESFTDDQRINDSTAIVMNTVDFLEAATSGRTDLETMTNALAEKNSFGPDGLITG